MALPATRVVLLGVAAAAAVGGAGWLLLRPAAPPGPPAVAPAETGTGGTPEPVAPGPVGDGADEGDDGDDDGADLDRAPHGELDAEALYLALEAAAKARKWLEFENLLRAHKGASDPRITALLLQGMDDPTFRNALAELAPLLGDPGAFPRFLELARTHKDEMTRAAALNAAALVGGVQAMEAAVEALSSSPPGSILGNAAAGVLARLGTPDAARAVVDLLRKQGGGPASAALLKALSMFKDAETLAELGRLAREDGDMVLRTAIVKAMGVGREPGSVPDLLRVARETDDADLRREALRSLGLVGTVEAVQELVNLLQGGEPDDRLTAALALQGVGRREAGPLLVKALESSSEDLVRGYLLHGIGQSKDPASLPSVLRIAADREQGEGVRAQAARAAGNIGDASAAPALLDLLDAAPKDQRALRASAITALGRIHDPVTRPRLQRMLDATPANTTEWFLLKQAVDGVVPGDLRAHALRESMR